MTQLPLDFGRHPAMSRAAWLASASNAAALAQVDTWRDWPAQRLVLCGPEGAGKTHLAQIWAAESGAAVLSASDLPEAGRLIDMAAVAIEDVDRVADLTAEARAQAEERLFHLYNALGTRGGHLLLTGRASPGHWRLGLPDLASRVASMQVAQLDPPDDDLLSGLLMKLFADRHVRPGSGVIPYLVRRIDRSAAAAEAAVDLLDRSALAEGKPVSRALAISVMRAAGD